MLRTALAPALAALLILPSCSGDPEEVAAQRTPEEVMRKAKATLDETSGVAITLEAQDLPGDLTAAVRRAQGVGTHPPAFEGTLTVVLSGPEFEVPVVAVDGRVYAQIPLTPGWSDVEPADYGAPDPARLMSTSEGVSSMLTATTGLERGESVRGGEDNREVLTEYTGSVSGDVVDNVIPSASGGFDAAYTVTDDDELRTARLTGVFYPDTDPMTYVIDFDDYGVEQDITAP